MEPKLKTGLLRPWKITGKSKERRRLSSRQVGTAGWSEHTGRARRRGHRLVRCRRLISLDGRRSVLSSSTCGVSQRAEIPVRRCSWRMLSSRTRCRRRKGTLLLPLVLMEEKEGEEVVRVLEGVVLVMWGWVLV